MKVLVTGAAGLLGSAVCHSLEGAGHEIRAIDRRYRSGLPVKLELADVRDELSVYRAMEGMDAVVHLANHPNPYAGPSNAALLSENMAMNANVFGAAADLGVGGVVFASSVQVMLTLRWPKASEPVYALPYLPLDGDCPACTRTNPYALSKHFGEQLLAVLVQANPALSATALRFPMLLAAWQRERFFGGGVAKLPRRRLDFHEAMAHLAVEDAAELVLRVVERQAPGYHQYFPAVSFGLAGYDVARTVREFYPDVPLRRPLEELDALIDLSAVRHALGWEPSLRIRAEIIDM